jgi:hypothetical protein
LGAGDPLTDGAARFEQARRMFDTACTLCGSACDEPKGSPEQVSQHGCLLRRCGCVPPASARGFDTHRDSITGRIR